MKDENTDLYLGLNSEFIGILGSIRMLLQNWGRIIMMKFRGRMVNGSGFWGRMINGSEFWGRMINRSELWGRLR